MTDVVPEIEPDLVPPVKQKVGQMLGLGDKHKDQEPKAKRQTRSTQTERKQEFDTLQEDLQTAYEFLGQMLAMSVSPNGGTTMMEQAGPCAAAWVEQAKKNPRIYRFLMTATTGSGWVAILMAHAPIAMAIQYDLRNPVQGGEPQNMQEVFDMHTRVDDTIPTDHETVSDNGVTVR